MGTPVNEQRQINGGMQGGLGGGDMRQTPFSGMQGGAFGGSQKPMTAAPQVPLDPTQQALPRGMGGVAYQQQQQRFPGAR